MKTKIYQTKYKDLEAVAIENSLLKAVFLPGCGGKMASLTCKKTGREFLVQAPNEVYNQLAYDGDYVAAECSGFDDMFPTIDKFTYEKFPWKGAVMPDHGEVCGLEWDYEITEDEQCLHCWVYGVRFAYRLDKWIRTDGEGELIIEYEVQNLSAFDMDFIWAGHIMINAEKDARVVTSYPNCADVTCVFSTDEGFGKYGMPMKWPVVTRSDKRTIDISKTTEERNDGNNYKIYFDETPPQGWCGYKYTDGTQLMLSFPTDTVPYLGLWVNEGGFKGYHNIALEPCTGSFDRPDMAEEHKQNSVLCAKGEYNWFVSFKITQYAAFGYKNLPKHFSS